MSLNAQLIIGAFAFMVVSGGIVWWAKMAFDREFPKPTDEVTSPSNDAASGRRAAGS